MPAIIYLCNSSYAYMLQSHAVTMIEIGGDYYASIYCPNYYKVTIMH